MNSQKSRSLRLCSLGTMILLALVAFGTSARPALGQDAFQGKFTLSENAWLGRTELSAGEYKFRVRTLGTIRSVGSIQPGNSQVFVMVWSTMKGGPAVSRVATALHQADLPNANSLNFRQEDIGTMIHSIGLENYRTVVVFNEGKPDGEMRPSGTQLAQAHKVAKGIE
jgi:hypothetical protein